MCINVHVVVFGAAVAAGFTPNRALGDQTASPAPAPAQPSPTGVLEREELTGDWGGLRTEWEDDGIVLESSLTQFYQGLAAGGIEKSSEYNGTAQAELSFDFGKLADWQYWSAEVKAELRFGGPLLGGIGSVNPVNTAVIIPGVEGTKFAITALNFTRLFPVDLQEGKTFALSFGRYNMLDLLDEHFFAGAGLERFFNLAQIGPLTVLRQVPLVTYGVSVAYIRAGQPFATFALIDPNDHSVAVDLTDVFEDGVTFFPGINFPTNYFGKTGKHTFGGAVTTKKYTPFDAIRQIILPGPPLNPIEPRAGSWSVNYVFRQYLVERGPQDGWGLFTQMSLADPETSPVTRFFDVGLGGNGVFGARARDEFGVAYAFTDLSEDLKDNLELLPLGGRLLAEHQVEAFYNFYITPWFQLTGDLQIIRPNLPVADTAIVPGVRVRIVF